MDEKVEFDILEGALKACGASWGAAQTHGLLSGRLATAGASAGPDWLRQVLEGTDDSGAPVADCRKLLDTVYRSTFWELSERLSEFEPLLPDDADDISMRIVGLSHWCEGFLHGLVSAKHGDALKERLGAPPLSDIIKDMLQITRAGEDEDGHDEESEGAYAELVEYLRVAAQLSYEELAEIRKIEMAESEVE